MVLGDGGKALPVVGTILYFIMLGYISGHDDVIKWKKRSALLALCERNPPVTGGFPSQRPVTRSFAFFYDLRLNKRLSKQSERRWFKSPSRSLWCHCEASRRNPSEHGWSLCPRYNMAMASDMEALLNYWPFVSGTHWLLVDSAHKGPVFRNVDFCLLLVWTSCLTNSQVLGGAIKLV